MRIFLSLLQLDFTVGAGDSDERRLLHVQVGDEPGEPGRRLGHLRLFGAQQRRLQLQGSVPQRIAAHSPTGHR